MVCSESSSWLPSDCMSLSSRGAEREALRRTTGATGAREIDRGRGALEACARAARSKLWAATRACSSRNARCRRKSCSACCPCTAGRWPQQGQRYCGWGSASCAFNTNTSDTLRLHTLFFVEARGGRPALAGIVLKLFRMEENADVMDAEGAAARGDGAFALEAGAGARHTWVALELLAEAEAAAPPSRVCSAFASS